MKKISWDKASDLAKNYNNYNKVFIILFTSKDCDICKTFIPLLELIENEHYEVFIVEDSQFIPFPPTSYPIGYIFIPGSSEKMPMQRIGFATENVIKIDAGWQIESFLTKRPYEQIREEARRLFANQDEEEKEEKKRTSKPWDFLNPKTKYVKKDASRERMKICESCPEFQKITKTCSKCKCFMPAKTKIEHSSCPIGKW